MNNDKIIRFSISILAIFPLVWLIVNELIKGVK